MSDIGVGPDQLRAFVERIERLEEEQKAINDDKSEVYKEAKGKGFDTKIMRKVIAIRRQDPNERLEQEAIIDTYLHALGMLDELPETGLVRAHVENIEEFDAETGEITEQPETAQRPEPADAAVTAGNALREPVAAEQGQIVRGGDAPREASNGEDRKIAHPDTELHPVANVGEGATGAAAAASDDPASREADVADRQQRLASGFTGEGEAAPADLPTNSNVFTIKRKALRPHCQRPDRCGGMGNKHCWSCSKAISGEGGAA